MIREKHSIFDKLRLYLHLEETRKTHISILFAYLGSFLASGGVPEFRILFWVGLAFLGASNGAMALNRLIDKNIDAKNLWTDNREMPSRKITVGVICGIILISYFLLFYAAYRLNPLSLKLALIILLTSFIYHYFKHFSPVFHIVGSLNLGYAVFGGWLAVTGTFAIRYATLLYPSPELAILLLLAAITLWATGVDIIYSLQDIDFYNKNRLYSIPGLLGIKTVLKLSFVFHLLMLVFLVGFFFVLNLGSIFIAGLLVIALLIRYQHTLVTSDNYTKIPLAFYNVNVAVSLTLFIFTVASLNPLSSCGYLSIDGGYYTLTQNVSAAGTCFKVLANNITIDGKGYKINYSQKYFGYGISSVGYDRLTIKNARIVQGSSESAAHALYLKKSSNDDITNNTLIVNGELAYGAFVYDESNDNVFFNNEINSLGPYGGGIVFENSTRNILKENIIDANDYAVYIEPTTVSAHYNQSIDGTNTERGKPIHYYKNVSSIVIENMDNIGELFIADSNNITVRNITLDMNGITFAKTTNSLIMDLNVSVSIIRMRGIYLHSGSKNNTIINNKIVNTGSDSGWGIFLHSNSNLNNISNNSVETSGINGHGIYLWGSSYNNISSNLVSVLGTNASGVRISHSSNNNTLLNNTVTIAGSAGYPIYLDSSTYTKVIGGIYLTPNLESWIGGEI